MKKHPLKMSHTRGFTLVEVLIAMAISGVLFSGIYYAYSSQQKSSIIQQEVSAMQRNLRSGMHFMEREIRMAGCDPTGKAGAGIITANKNALQFTEDIRGDAAGSAPDGYTDDPNEGIGYTLADYGLDGDTDLLRNNALIAENVDVLDFVYLDKHGTMLDDDGHGNVTNPDSLALISSIQITLVARTGIEDPTYTDNTTYKNQQGDIYTATGDHFRRRLITTNIKLRNPVR